MDIKGLKNMSENEIKYELQNGAQFIVYKYCISIFVLTFKWDSSVYFIKKDQSKFMQGIPYTAVSLVFGWWGLPWGPIHTISSVFTNLKGGKDMTDEIREALYRKE